MATEQDTKRDEEQSGRDSSSDNGGEGNGEGKIGLDRDDDEQSFVDTSKIDFDPDEGLYSGTAVDGTSEIPGPHLSGESGELSEEDLHEEAKKQAEEAGVDPEDTPAAKSSVARAAEQERQRDESGKADADGETDEDAE